MPVAHMFSTLVMGMYCKPKGERVRAVMPEKTVPIQAACTSLGCMPASSKAS